MTGEKQTAYDEVHYPTVAYEQTHPDRLATIATILGMRPAPVERCRVLELACGDGANLISMAHGLPGSEFVGLDIASREIGAGARMIADLGLRNIRLAVVDLMEFRADGAPFDFIIAHGLYSWAPTPVRDRVLAIFEENLAPNGVAYLSYNAYPGCHIRDVARRMMMYHVRSIPDPQVKIEQGRALLQFLAGSKDEPLDVYRTILAGEHKMAVTRSDGGFYHDDLNPFNQPFYLHEVLEQAAKRNLQFLGEADFSEMHPKGFTPEVQHVLQQMDDDPVMREQYLDFLTGRCFRSTLLCRGEVPLDHQARASTLRGFHASFEGGPILAASDIASTDSATFQNRKGNSIQTDHPILKAALSRLSGCWPRALRFEDLLPSRDLARGESAVDRDAEEGAAQLCVLLLSCYAAGVVELHSWAPPLATEISERPVASPLARYQCEHEKRLTTLWHRALDLDTDLARQLVVLLDGTRTHSALAEALTALVQSGKTRLVEGEKCLADAELVRGKIEDMLPDMLKALVRNALLVG